MMLAVFMQKFYLSIYKHSVFVFTYQWRVSPLPCVQNAQKKSYAVNSNIAESNPGVCQECVRAVHLCYIKYS